MSLLLQILATIFLVLGISLGEILSARAFGLFKKNWMYLVEILLFIPLLIAILNYIKFEEISLTKIVFINFIIGFSLIIFIRGLLSGAGIFAERVKEVILKIRKEEDYLLGLKKALERRGFKLTEIKRIAKEIGFDEKKISEVICDKELKKIAKQRKIY